jgi:hypothetical protein
MKHPLCRAASDQTPKRLRVYLLDWHFGYLPLKKRAAAQPRAAWIHKPSTTRPCRDPPRQRSHDEKSPAHLRGKVYALRAAKARDLGGRHRPPLGRHRSTIGRELGLNASRWDGC